MDPRTPEYTRELKRQITLQKWSLRVPIEPESSCRIPYKRAKEVVRELVAKKFRD
jgi:hypothetical protein